MIGTASGFRMPRGLKLLQDLHHKECRWPVSEDEWGSHLFCAAEAVEGRAYCAEHGARSTADGSYPPIAPRGPVETPRARRDYLDQRRVVVREREPDVVALVEQGELAYGPTVGQLYFRGVGRAR